MRRHTIPTAVVGLTAALTLAGCSSSEPTDTQDTSNSASPGSAADFNQADVTYAQGMTMHHQQAVDMSDTVLDKDGLDPEVARLARDIKDAQGPEIRTMEGWLEDWGHPMDHGGHGSASGDEGHMDGMVSAEDIRALERADGATASRLFLDQMIEHHEGAVDMAKQHRKDGHNPEALQLSEDVITDQQAEITEMRQMRKTL